MSVPYQSSPAFSAATGSTSVVTSVATLTVEVAAKATAGVGTFASPWTGWDTAINWSGTAGTGTISVTQNVATATVTGVGTSFTSQVTVGQYIVAGGSIAGQVSAITNDTTLSVVNWNGATQAGAAFTIYSPATYHFAAGVYAYATSPNFGLPFIRIYGDGQGTIFKHTGSGTAFNASPSYLGTGTGAYGAQFDNFSIRGNASTVTGFAVGRLNHTRVDNVLVQNATTTGIAITNVVGGTWTNVRYSVNEAIPNTPAPTTGWALSSVTLLDLTGCLAEGAATGVSLASSAWIHWNGGTIEANSVVGLLLDSASNNCSFFGPDLESNAIDAQINGYSNTFVNLNSTSTFAINPGAGNGNNNVILNGAYNAITVAGIRNSLIGLIYGNSAGALTDTGTNTTKIAVVNNATGKLEPTQIAEHMKFLGTVPTAGAASGSTGATMAFDAGSTDTSGIITVTQTNTAPSTSGAVTATYANAFPGGTVPRILAMLMTGSLSWANGATAYIASSTNTAFQINFTNAATNFAAGTYKIVYFILG